MQIMSRILSPLFSGVHLTLGLRTSFTSCGTLCQKFVRFYLFFSLRTLFFPRTLVLLTHVLTFAMISPHVLSPLFHFAFTIHNKSEPLRTQRSRFEDLSKNRSYLLARLFARHLLPSDPISQGAADSQPRSPFLHELVMALYITRNRVQGDSRRRRSLTTG